MGWGSGGKVGGWRAGTRRFNEVAHRWSQKEVIMR